MTRDGFSFLLTTKRLSQKRHDVLKESSGLCVVRYVKGSWLPV